MIICICRQLQSSHILQTGSAEEAKQCQECIQRLASWTGQPQPRRLTVIINPKSGQGRYKLLCGPTVHPACMRESSAAPSASQPTYKADDSHTIQEHLAVVSILTTPKLTDVVDVFHFTAKKQKCLKGFDWNFTSPG